MLFSLPQVVEIVAESHADTLLSVSDVAARLGIGQDQVRQWGRDGILPARKVGGRFVFSLAQLTLWQLGGMARLSAESSVPSEDFVPSLN